MTGTISNHSFRPEHLDIAGRKPGLSAFMRIRNGADYLEATIRSHIDCFDEIVAVHNQCTDATPDILARLAAEFGPRLRVFHYADRVFPPGSDDHARTDPTSPNSLVNYYNTALALTRFRAATKLDDDHLAIGGRLAEVTGAIRARGGAMDAMACFSGLNIIRLAGGGLAIPAFDPVSGGGDIGFFEVTPATKFGHDRRFERFQRGGAKRVFAGFLYWHLKYMKAGMGFANYEIDGNPASRYARRLKRIEENGMAAIALPELAERLKPGIADQVLAAFSEKARLRRDRNAAIAATFGGMDVDAAIAASVDPAMLALAFGPETPR